MLDFLVIIFMGEGVKAKNVHYIVYTRAKGRVYVA